MSNIFEKNTTLKLVSIAIAIILWTMSPYNRDPFRDWSYREVPLIVENEDNLHKKGLILATDLPETFDIELRGRNSDRKNLNPKELKVYVDLSKVSKPGDTNLPVDVKGVPKGLELKHDYKIKLKIDRIVLKTIPVSLKFDGETTKELGKHYIDVNPQQIEIEGPESIVGQVAYGQISFNLDETGGMVERSIPVQLVDQRDKIINTKYITKSPEYSIVKVYPYKTLPVTPIITGLPAEGYVVMGTEVNPKTISVSGNPEVLGGMDSVCTEILDIKGAVSDIRRNLKLQQYEGVHLSPGQQSFVEVLVRIDKIVEKTVNIDNIEIRNMPENRNAEIEDTQLTLILRGPESLMLDSDIKNIVLYVDVNGARKGERTYPVKVENVPEGLEVADIQSSNVTVVVK